MISPKQVLFLVATFAVTLANPTPPSPAPVPPPTAGQSYLTGTALWAIIVGFFFAATAIIAVRLLTDIQTSDAMTRQDREDLKTK